MKFEYEVKGGDFSNAGTASSNVKKILRQLNVDGKLIKRTVVALYEAEVNIVAHAFKGVITVDVDTSRIDIILDDSGPGIEDIDKAMEAGYSTASEKVREMGFGAGMGLSNIRKNTDEFSIESKVGEGTRLHFVNYLSN